MRDLSNRAIQKSFQYHPQDISELRKRFDDYVRAAFYDGGAWETPESTDYYNNELIEIEKRLPFRNESEDERWYNLLDNDRVDEWIEMTNDLIRRKENL